MKLIFFFCIYNVVLYYQITYPNFISIISLVVTWDETAIKTMNTQNKFYFWFGIFLRGFAGLHLVTLLFFVGSEPMQTNYDQSFISNQIFQHWTEVSNARYHNLEIEVCRCIHSAMNRVTNVQLFKN